MSSTDVDHYNRIQLGIPIFSSRDKVNVTVSGFTTNGNIQSVELEDYMDIAFNDGFESITTRVNFIPTSTLSLAILDEYLTNIFKAYNINLSVKMNDLSLL
jgi:hypothetical protein